MITKLDMKEKDTQHNYEQLQNRIIGTTIFYQQVMGIGDIAISHSFNTTQLSEVVAECNPLWEYHTADITWYLKGHEDMDVANTAVHELVHVMLAPIQEFVPKKQEKISEWVTESIAKAIIRAKKWE